ncbi:MAG TPA: cytochrome b/b6 domain-containing protein [Scandinavium sp.]|jgi:thiosulfate reductase cytochrome b subunit|uniref:cytochrome b/b6 domain-containing protein n=1 Tax=Scandinavium sp. TaxID=2830653 RepID=UPI002E2F8B3D|nr:cytochrome b/b6 domain-containing protein [Scandinavium sp.]HEX4501227.1 cytochrome b/b6 domain-containing protein [Scandinavium sp.]
MSSERSKTIHPLWVRCCHWVNAIAIAGMMFSGWRIYNASPLFDFTFPREITLGGWLGGALQWHFAMMWVLGINGAVYLTLGVISGRFKRKFFPLSPRELFNDLRQALRGKLAHADLSHYNMVQKLAYVGVILLGIGLVLSGLVLWKSVQFPLLRELLGGYETARYIHFFCMSAMALFVVIHLLMVLLVPRTLLAMLRGR